MHCFQAPYKMHRRPNIKQFFVLDFLISTMKAKVCSSHNILWEMVLWMLRSCWLDITSALNYLSWTACLNVWNIDGVIFFLDRTISDIAVAQTLKNSYFIFNKSFATNDHNDMVQNPPGWRAVSLLFPHWGIKTNAIQAWLVWGLFV